MDGDGLGRGPVQAVDGTGDWRDAAVCRREDPELFFPVGNSAEAQEQTAAAKSVCRQCPGREPCLRWALDTGQTNGVWGGYSEQELALARRRVLRQRRTGVTERGRATG